MADLVNKFRAVTREKAVKAAEYAKRAAEREGRTFARTENSLRIVKTKRFQQSQGRFKWITKEEVANSVILDPIPEELLYQAKSMPTQEEFFEAVAYIQNTDRKCFDIDKLFPRRERITAIEKELIAATTAANSRGKTTDKPDGYNASDNSASWRFAVKQGYEYFPEPTKHPKTSKEVYGLYEKINTKQIKAIEAGKTEFHPRPIPLEESYNLMVRYHYRNERTHRGRDEMFDAMIKDMGCSFSKITIQAFMRHCPRCKHRYSDPIEVLDKKTEGSESRHDFNTANQSQAPFYQANLPQQIDHQKHTNYQDQTNLQQQIDYHLQLQVNLPQDMSVYQQVNDGFEQKCCQTFNDSGFYSGQSLNDGSELSQLLEEFDNDTSFSRPIGALDPLETCAADQGSNIDSMGPNVWTDPIQPDVPLQAMPSIQDASQEQKMAPFAFPTDLAIPDLQDPFGRDQVIIESLTDEDWAYLNWAERNLPPQPGINREFDILLIRAYEGKIWGAIPDHIFQYYRRCVPLYPGVSCCNGDFEP